MLKIPHLCLSVIMSVLTLCCTGTEAEAGQPSVDQSEQEGLANYPRIERFEQGTVLVDFPSLDVWPDFRTLKAWLPIEVKLEGDRTPRVGSVYVQALTDIDFDQRTVTISNLKVLKTKFSDADSSDVVTQLAHMAFQGRERVVPLDVLLRLLPEDFKIPGAGDSEAHLNFDPPVILVSETPLKLLSIDKEPVRAPITGTDLEFVVNSNWNVFYDTNDERWYVLNDGTWQHNNYLADGGWTSTDELPADFNRLALSDHWPEVQKALPARLPENPPVPFVISLEATELIQSDGAPRLDTIGDTGIRYVSNTQSDLFRYGGQWYFLVSGRWFSSEKLQGSWQAAGDLPAAFASIPPKHKKAHVLYSVPGTRQARLALIEAALPHRVAVPAGIASELEVSWVGEPRFGAIETTHLQRGLNTPFQVILHNNFYYLCYEGAWYFSDSPTGPWKTALQIPDEIYRIPATDPAYNVTFVKLDNEQESPQQYVNYSYSSGYRGSFSTRVSVVYGTGWHYPSSVYWDSSDGPIYWRSAATYGYNTGYYPVGAFYGGRSGFYGGWGWGGFGGACGYGGWYGYGCGPHYSSITIESPTVNFNHGYGSSWDGPLQTTPGDPAKTAERSLDKFLPKKKTSGKEEFVATSKAEMEESAALSASSLYAGSSLSSSMISGPDGEVYKRDGEQWRQYSQGNWNTMQAMEQQYRSAPQARPAAESRSYEPWLPAHKRTLSRAELDRQELARIEGMDNYARYRMEKESGQ